MTIEEIAATAFDESMTLPLEEEGLPKAPFAQQPREVQLDIIRLAEIVRDAPKLRPINKPGAIIFNAVVLRLLPNLAA